MNDQVADAGVPVSASDVPGFVFADLERRVFLALNRAGDSYHYVHPVDAQDRRVLDGLATPGILVCECAGGRYRGSCYQTAKAESRLREAGLSVVGWLEPAPEAEQTERSIGAEQLNGFGGVR